MNLQPILDFVARHLLTQNVQAKNSEGDCYYRTPDGLSCAVGCLMRNYYTIFEGHAITNNDLRPQFNAALGHTLTKDEVTLLSSLQAIHDTFTPSSWEHHLRELAIRYQLQPFSRCDLEGGRGREHPFPLRTPAKEERAMDSVS